MTKLDKAFSSLPGTQPPNPNTAPLPPAPSPFLFMTQATPEQVQTVAPFTQPSDAETEVLKSDVSILNFEIGMIMQAWQKPLTVKGVIELADMTNRFMKHRRDILKMPYGAPVNNRKTGAFEVLD